ncbi:carbohydrate ABC transporter permease [Tessaracoccus lapidicaptus]|uniref:carbohydrate ABC transporter permease n=1 Tax=Tessaracoccus lapidicaptus TaxID=1427523 RepID=UPI0033408EDB
MPTPKTLAPRAAVGTASSRGARPRRRGRRPHWVFALPAAVFLAAFSLYPLVQLVRMSFSAVTSGTLNQAWQSVGLDNYLRATESGEMQAALMRTAAFVVVVTLSGMILGIAGAIALRTRGRWSSIVLAVMVFCWALPPVVNGSVWKFLLAKDGLVNSIALGLGLTDTAYPFLYDQTWALMSVAFVCSWAVIPFNVLVFRAALMQIDQEQFEAAALDGANRWQEVRHVMLPAVRPTTLVLLILTVVYGFRSFDYIYVMTYGGPGTATNTLPFLGFLQAFQRYDYGLGAATSVIAVALVLVLAAVYARSILKEEKE